MRGANGFIRTVLGDVDPRTLGPTYGHEHLLFGPVGDWARGEEDLLLDDEDRAARELELFRDAGGNTIVEVTTPELGRDPAGLRRLASRTGVQIVAATGRVCEEYWPGGADPWSVPEDELAKAFTRDLIEGMDRTEVLAGVIKVGSSLGRVTKAEHRVIRAAVAAHQETGAPITTHTTAGTAAKEQLRALVEAGADPSRVCIGHLDRRLDWEDHLALAREGVFLGYDCLGKEQYEPDEKRIRFIVRLVEEGHGEQIVLAGDMARRSYFRSWGGRPGYGFILSEFVPRLRDAGLAPEEIQSLLVDNPARFLTWR
jgi:predicted metal-dependent phosphotriesterase family hydrolase